MGKNGARRKGRIADTAEARPDVRTFPAKSGPPTPVAEDRIDAGAQGLIADLFAIAGP